MKIEIEKEIFIKSINIHGFIDLVAVDCDGAVYVYDFKSIGSWSWRFKFGRKEEKEPSIHQELQLATYGLAVLQEYGRCDGLYLVYYNKDSSAFKQVEVDKSMIDVAYSFWNNVGNLHKRGCPPLEEKVSPVMNWECNYCQYKDFCNEAG